MSPRRTDSSSYLDDILLVLRSLRLLPCAELDRVALAWSDADDPRARLNELVEQRLLTAWQAERLRRGRGRSLQLGPYLLLDRLGVGGMGRVYKVEHRLMKRLAALKILDRGKAADRDDEAAFRREAEAAAQLFHPNIVLTYDAGVARGRRFLVMEYVEGVNLEMLVRRCGPLPPPLVGEAMRQAARALEYAWRRGLAHNDVKPANLMLVRPAVSAALPSPAEARFKLLDLGLARCARGRSDSGLSAAASLLGTPNYLAPERADDPECADVRSDLYSLGCTAYYLLTGQPPYPGGDWPSKLEQHRRAPVPSVRALRPEASPALDAVLQRLLAKAPADRYGSPTHLLDALTREQESPVPSRLSQTVAASPRRAPVRGRLAAVAVVLTGLLLIAAARLGSPAPPQPTTAPTPGPEPFQVEHLSGFATLAEAVSAARDNDVITIRGAGPYRTPPLRWQGKALTLRSEVGQRPCLEMDATPDDPPWRAMLCTDRALTLHGLELRHASDSDSAGSLICCEGAPLHASHCRMRSRSSRPAFVLLHGEELELRDCRVEGEALVAAVEIGPAPHCRLALHGSRLLAHAPSGTALALWAQPAATPTAVALQLEGCDVSADQIVLLRALPGRLSVQAHNNALSFTDALLSFQEERRPGAWREQTTWQGSQNRCDATGAWLRVGKEVHAVEELPGWERVVGSSK
jgi:serine/threonine protein kinase